MLQPSTASPVEALDDGADRFDRAIVQRGLTLPPHGAREAAFEIEATCKTVEGLSAFWKRMALEQPYYTGFPPWVDSRRFADNSSRPVEIDNALQALIIDLESGEMNDIDFWCIHPPTTFYHRRALEDDVSRSSRAPEPLTQIDFLLQVSRVTEVIAVGLAFARELTARTDIGSLSFAFRWRGLHDRKLSAWVDPLVYRAPSLQSQQDEVVSTCVVPLAAPPSWIPNYVDQAVAPLFDIFGKNVIPRHIVDGIASKLLQRAFG
jgi:hypothetical protein